MSILDLPNSRWKLSASCSKSQHTQCKGKYKLPQTGKICPYKCHHGKKMIGRGKPYKLSGSKKSLIRSRHGEKALFCPRCEEPLEVGQMIRRAGTRSTKWYHEECFEKMRY